MTTLPTIKIKGLFWQAEAQAIRLEGPLPQPNDDNWTLRNLWVEKRKDNDRYTPGTLIALCWIRRIKIEPLSGKTYEWERSTKFPQSLEPPYEPRPSLTEIQNNLQSGEFALLLLQADPESSEWKPNQIPDFTCIAGDIYLIDALQPQNNSRDRLYNALGVSIKKDSANKPINPTTRPDRSQLLAPIAVHGSGLTLFGEVQLPWFKTKLTAPFQLSPLIKNGLPTPKFRLQLEGERLIPPNAQGIISEEVKAWIKAWQTLSQFVDPLSKQSEVRKSDLKKYSSWVTLQVNNPNTVPPLYWQIDTWPSSDSTPQSYPVSFTQNAFRLVFTDQSLYTSDTSPNSLAQVVPLVTIQSQQDSLILQIFATKEDQENQEILTEKFVYTGNQIVIVDQGNQEKEIWQESINLSNLTTTFSPTQVPQFLRENQDISTPEWFPKLENDLSAVGSVAAWQNILYCCGYTPELRITGWMDPETVEITKKFQKDLGLKETGEVTLETWQAGIWISSDTKIIEPALIWGFMPLEDGWAQLPFPNLTEQIYLDANLARSSMSNLGFQATSPKMRSLLQGAVSFGNERESVREQVIEENAWSVTLVDATRLSGTWKLEKKSDASEEYELTAIKVTLGKPDVNIRGLFWLSTGKPRPEDALPDLSNWVSGLQSIPLRTLQAERETFPPLVELFIKSLSFSPRTSPERENSQEILAASLGEWQFRYQIRQEVFRQMMDKRILAKDTFVQFLPIIWRRHPHLPMIQALPMTQSQSPPNYPSASRQLVPYELPINSEGIPNSWDFGITETEAKGALNWAKYLNPEILKPAKEWVQQLDLSLVSLSLLGLVFSPKDQFPYLELNQETQLYLQYRFDLPYTDEVNALAQLPKVPPKPDEVSPLPDSPRPQPAKPLTRETFGDYWQQLSERASLASGDAIFGLVKREGKVFVENLIEPLAWEVNATIDLNVYPGRLQLGNADGTAMLPPLEGNKALEGISGQFIRSNGNIKLNGAGNNSYNLTAGSMTAHLDNGQIRDQRGLSRGISKVDEVESVKLLTTSVSFDNKSYDLMTTLEALPLKINDRVTWRLWFRDMPFEADAFDRNTTLSPQAEDINDPEAQSLEYNYRNGYEWRLNSSVTSALPLDLLGLHFYPLRLAKMTIINKQIDTIEIIGRLQLPLAGIGEIETLSNAVNFQFKWKQDIKKYVPHSLSLSSFPSSSSSSSSSVETLGEWILNPEVNSNTNLRLEWKNIKLSSDNTAIELSELTLKFHLFDTKWIVPLNGKSLSFPNAAEIKHQISELDDFSLTEVMLNFSQPSSPNISLDFSVKFGDRRAEIPPENSRVTKGLQVLYTFTEGNGDIIRDRSQINNPLNLKIKNADSTAIDWLPEGGLRVKHSNIIKSINNATELIAACKQTNEISIEVWIKPTQKIQEGAKIVTLSKDRTHRNFTLAQGVFGLQSEEYNVRLRHTSASDLNDGLPALKTGSNAVIITEPSHIIYTRKKGEIKIYCNGQELTPQQTIQSDGDFSNWDDSYFFALGNEITEDRDRAWLGEYYLVAVYNRALTSEEVKQNFSVGNLLPEPVDSQREAIAFRAKVKYDLLNQPAVTLTEGILLDDLKINLSNTQQLITDDTLQIRWQECTSEKIPYLLPGISLQPSLISGYAALTFTAEPRSNTIPLLKINSATVEALMSARWGKFLQDQETIIEDSNERFQQIFGSSAGDLVIGYTGELQTPEEPINEEKQRVWKESLLLNGMVELKNLVSWPQAIKIQNTAITLPAIPSTQRVTEGLQLLYTFSEGGGNEIFDRSGTSTPLNLKIADRNAVEWLSGGGLVIKSPTIIKSDKPAQELIQHFQSRDEITFEAWIKPASQKENSSNYLEQRDARIFTLSSGSYDRNFAVTQAAYETYPDEFAVHLRRSGISVGTKNGQEGRPFLRSSNVVISDLTHLVFTRKGNEFKIFINSYERSNASIYDLDSNQNDNEHRLDGDFSNWNANYYLALANEISNKNSWLGEYYLLAVYDRALNPDEIKQNFHAGHRLPFHHLRHTSRILFNQHLIPPSVLVAGTDKFLLFNLISQQPWHFLAVVEHQLINVKPHDFQSEKIELNGDRRWTAVQAISVTTPNQFRKFINKISQSSIDSPALNATNIEINFGYLRSRLRSLLATGSNSALGKLQDNMLLIEAINPLWIGKTPLKDTQQPISLQFLPNGIQQAILSRPQDYVPSAPSQPDWLLLVMPFLGRLQPEFEDKLDKLEPQSVTDTNLDTLNPLQVDPILYLHYWRELRSNQELPSLALALTHWANSVELGINISGFDTIIGRLWSRLDPLALEESWFRLQNPPQERNPESLQSILAGLPDTSARLSRDAALQRLFSIERVFYPPQVSSLVGEISSNDDQLIKQSEMLQGVIAEPISNKVPYGWLLSGILLVQAFGGESTESLICHASATILPARLKRSNNQPNPFPQTLAVSPYLRLLFQSLPLSIKKELRLVVAELLCLNPSSQVLRPVASYTWESQKFIAELDFRKFLDNPSNKATIRERFRQNQITLSNKDEQIKVERIADEWKIVDDQTKFTCRVREQNQQLIFYQDRQTIGELANSWAQQTQELLYPESTITILRFREIDEVISDDKTISPLVIRYDFELVENAVSKLEIKRIFALRSPLRQLRFREAQFNPGLIPNLETIKPFEVAPPQTAGVQPIYLLPPESNSQGDWGLTALRVSIHYSEGQQAIADSLLNGSEHQHTLWWQGCQHTVQFRSAKTAGNTNAVAGLPPLFRAPAIKGFLPAVSDLPLPDIKLNHQEKLQSILPGSLSYLLLGNRPGVMFALRHQLLRQPLGQSSEVLVSGSIPVQHRMPRPVPLPDNQGQEVAETEDRTKERALQTWASYFEPQKRLIAETSPIDEAFYAQCGEFPARRLQMELTFPEYGAILTNWDGSLVFEINSNPEVFNIAKWDIKVSLMNGEQLIEYQTPTSDISQSHYKFTLKDKENNQSVLKQLLSQKIGYSFTVLVRIELILPQNRFQKILSFPLILAGQFARPLAIEPYFIHFEDPEYNRRLASASAHSSRTIKLKKASEMNVQLITLTLSADRREYNTDSLLSFRFDWNLTQEELVVLKETEETLQKKTTATLKFTRISNNQEIEFEYAQESGQVLNWEPGHLQSFLLNQFIEKNNANRVGLQAGDKLKISVTKLEITEYNVQEDLDKNPIVLIVNIVATPVNPVPQAAYALLRTYKFASNTPLTEVECVRFAWSPEPERIELVCAEDLRQEVVRRRAVFHWQDSTRISEVKPIYEIQKITETGSTHFPGFE